MPEHAHLVIYPPNGLKVGKIIGTLKSRTAFYSLKYLRMKGFPILNKLIFKSRGKHRTVFWQKRCYDHNCRNMKTTLEKINYCHKNPVIRGFVDDPSKWKWSSHNWYMGERDVPLIMDDIEADNL